MHSLLEIPCFYTVNMSLNPRLELSRAFPLMERFLSKNFRDFELIAFSLLLQSLIISVICYPQKQ